jgi:hypothetical protein
MTHCNPVDSLAKPFWPGTSQQDLRTKLAQLVLKCGRRSSVWVWLGHGGWDGRSIQHGGGSAMAIDKHRQIPASKNALTGNAKTRDLRDRCLPLPLKVQNNRNKVIL